MLPKQEGENFSQLSQQDIRKEGQKEKENPFWSKGPDGKFYAAIHGLERASEEWLKRFGKKNHLISLKKKIHTKTKHLMNSSLQAF